MMNRLQPAAAALLLLWPVMPALRSSAASLTLANPHWNITLTDAGYSDLLLDNTPGFEGREYLSGEWGAAVAYQIAGEPRTPPQWLEKYFIFPDWTNNSTFQTVAPLAQTGVNADNLPIAESVVANAAVRITLRHEMLDTVVGMPMGVVPASAGGSNFIASSRYVLKQTVTIENISSAAISGLQFFQLAHGFHSQRGVYDDRAYPGALGEYRYDVTLAGVDPYSAGANSSSLGLEDFFGFNASVAPSGFEIGYYGVEGNGLDDHWMGKPSEGVHLSIEDNWQNAPYNTRLGTDSFAPPQRWVSGAQRWDLGSLAPGQFATLDLVLGLRTGTRVGSGQNSGGSCNGGSSVPGGEDYEFDDVTSPGSCFGEYSRADADEVAARIAQGEFGAITFLQTGGPQQIWKLKFTGSFDGAARLRFGYDPTLLPPGLDQSGLTIYQFDGAGWIQLTTAVDLARHTLAVTTTTLSVFALGVDSGTFHTITADAAPAGAGTISGAGPHAEGTIVTLVATAGPGYAFTNWTEGATVVGGSPGYSFIAHADRSLTANFVSVGPNKAVSTSALPAEGGTTTGDGAYPLNATATVIATPNPGYKFSKWLEKGAILSTASTHGFTVTGDHFLVAKFKPVYSIVVTAEPALGGEVEADPAYEMGETAKLKAIPFPGYCFVNWTQNGLEVSTEPIYTFTVTGSRTLVGHFAEGNRIDASANPGLGGTVTGGGVHKDGETVILVATANPGYAFLDWTENGATVSVAETYSFTSVANRTLVAQFIAAAPRLDISFIEGKAVISWPALDTYTLQQNPGLDAPGWTDVNTGIVLVSGRLQFAIGSPTGPSFFRLIRR